MLHDKLWFYNDIPDEAALKLSRESGVSILSAKVFISRGIEDAEYVKSFMCPSLDELHDPFLMKDMDKAAKRITKAVHDNEKIVIYGDYDVDGITSTSILINFLRSIGADTDFFIPDRMNEGYGLSLEAVQRLLLTKPSLIITVDCGITSVKEVEYINKNHIDVVITDHHECRDELPDAYAVINPLRCGCSYPFKELAGVGVAYKLISALCTEMGLGNAHYAYLDLAALGTVADVVPLTGENRAIVRYGLAGIENSSNLGIKTLINNCGLKDKPITSWTVSFVLAPRINAAGRIGDAGRAVRLFTTDDSKEAADIVLKLNDENKFRQDTEGEILKAVMQKIEAGIDLQKDKVIIVSGENWHHGVIGIVASRITEKFYRPCILFSHEKGTCKGSGRSIEGFNMFKALSFCGELLENYGGHELAAGLEIRPDNLEKFKETINLYAESVLNEEDMAPKIKIDVKIEKNDISLANIRELEKLAPFGAGNPCPVFLYGRLKASEIKTVGENRHLKLRLEDGGFAVDAIGFNMGGLADRYNNKDILDAVFSLEINKWNSNERIQLNLKDLRYNDEMMMERQYYYSLDKCQEFCGIVDSGSGKNDGTHACCQNEEDLHNIIRENDKIVIFVNTLENVKKLKVILKKYLPSIKKQFKICYTCLNGNEKDSVAVVINPVADRIELKDLDGAIFYGTWIDKDYLDSLLSKLKGKSVYMLSEDKSFDIEEIIPERRDMVAVYQSLKAKVCAELMINDMFTLAKEIEESYRISMNYFKLKKCIEILEELKLLEKEAAGRYGMMIKFPDTVKEKKKLENSSLYRRFQLLKSESIKSCF